MANAPETKVTHGTIERSTTLLFVLSFLVVAIGGLVEVVPLFRLDETIKPVTGVRPYTPLEQLGRNIYTREGCYTCHSQQVRPFRDEVERYGHYSIAAESMYDHPFLWGSKRTGPDLARVGGKYSNAWHVAHIINPRDVVPVSVMPAYPFLWDRDLKYDDISDHLRALRKVDVPYSSEGIIDAADDIRAQATGEGTEGLLARYPGAKLGDFDGRPDRTTEMDALIAYLQVLGTMVDFSDVRLDKPKE
ncbi:MULTISPECIES: cytochrome-c oxidase, cbb3-type subunit II [unclassified Sinorhizobium]|uniref:cytochrome-c oxidase, cbb3-type subunit II n=1 Tax=unclassified Sinorhizobium TaxID=2613772 RepID=UPI0024C46C17|nr:MULTISPECIES: cytochrome-c oxidase, cbb3-type subunit II [unclassified Sinorhizobium]MDK1376806.1 cytochrome-c oxidase, cbb3-type subunit II [Sinorhizobium sp. 6-70]MDK1479578.1 cytochrome-c oxidase, cbb3-type subunit II [Sinorhizobium sp. 6-117]